MPEVNVVGTLTLREALAASMDEQWFAVRDRIVAAGCPEEALQMLEEQHKRLRDEEIEEIEELLRQAQLGQGAPFSCRL